MKENEATTQRSSLGFAEVAVASLSQILRPYGLLCMAKTDEAVRFESPDVVVSCSHGQLSYEIDVRLSHASNPTEEMSLADLLDAVVGPGHNIPTFFQASSKERMEQCFGTICDILKTHGTAALSGDKTIFNAMVKASQIRSTEYTNHVVNEPLRKSAEIAWKNKDYTKVKDLYARIRGNLTAVEAKRLAYANQHSAD